MILQRVKGLKWRELGPGVLTGVKNREQPNAFFGELARLFRDNPAAINLDLKSKIAHRKNLTRRSLKRNAVPSASVREHRATECTLKFERSLPGPF